MRKFWKTMLSLSLATGLVLNINTTTLAANNTDTTVTVTSDNESEEIIKPSDSTEIPSDVHEKHNNLVKVDTPKYGTPRENTADGGLGYYFWKLIFEP